MKLNRLRNIAILMMTIMGLLPATASENFTYEASTAIDLGLGVNFNIANYHSEDFGAALFSGRLGNPQLSLRVSHFFSRHWGAYVKAEWTQNSYLCSQKTMLDKLHAKNDGYDYITSGNPKGRRGYAFLAGGVYRWDKNRWSLRPMLALGFSSYNLNREFTAYRKTVGTNHLDELRYSIEQDKIHGIGSFVISPTIEASLHVTHHIDFFCNLTYEYNTAHVWQRFTITDVETGQELENSLAHERIGNNIAINFGIRYILK